MNHPPRPWSCNDQPNAIFCTHHGDCTCVGYRWSSSCPLHGDSTDHPLREPRMVAPGVSA